MQPTQPPAETVDVLVIGGSLVGLSTAMFLGIHGIRALAVERHASTAIHPRAGHFQLRTAEILRSAGLEERVRRRSEEQYVPNGGINAQDIASLGAILAGHGLDQMQVQGLVARMQKLGVQVALGALPEMLEDIRRIQEARIWGAISQIQALSSMGGYVRRDQVLLILNGLSQRTPRQ